MINQYNAGGVTLRPLTFDEQVESFRAAHSGDIEPKAIGSGAIRVFRGPPAVLNGRTCRRFALWVIRTHLQVRFGVCGSETAAKRAMKRAVLADSDQPLTLVRTSRHDDC